MLRKTFLSSRLLWVDPSGRAVHDMILRPLTCWNCGFEFLRGHRCLSVVSVVCCQVGVFIRADPSSRVVLPNEMCLWVMVKPR